MTAAVVMSSAIFLLLVVVQAVEVMDRLQVKKYLQRYGYLNQETEAESISSGMLKFGIKKYQLTYGLPATGRIDNHTLNLMMTPRCGVTDLGIRSSRRRSSSNGTGQSAYKFFEGNPKWGRGELFYRYEVNDELPSHINYEAAIFRAVQRWEAVCPAFNFRRVPDYDMPVPGVLNAIEENFHVGWYSGDHGDGQPFGGRGAQLAHASPPPSYAVMHFNADEIWRATEGFDVLDFEADVESVAVHEIGHMLGLEHTDVQEAIMYPYLGYGIVKRGIQNDDIQGLAHLYSFCNLVQRDKGR